MHLRIIFIILFILLLTIDLVKSEEETHYLESTDQKGINEALRNYKHVHLKAGNYEIDGPIKINSNNILSGDSDAVVSVKVSGGQWYTGSTGLICTDGPVDNIEIYGFQINGNCDKLPFEYHHSRSDTAHDCQRAILINGQTGRFSTNVKIHDMQIENCFSDGIHVRMAEGVHCYNNFISNCQHEGIFWVSVKEGIAENNRIAGITSDCFRTDNGVNNLIQNNYFFSYTGNSNNKAPKGANNGIQIADAGSSHGYDASKKPTSTTNIEVKGNTFANTGSKAVWLDSTGKGYDNVYIHDNKFVDVAVFTNHGESVEVKIKPTNEVSQAIVDITETVEPTKEMSEKVFSSIFDFFFIDAVERVDKNDTVFLGNEMYKEAGHDAVWELEQHDLGNMSYTLVSGPTEGLTEVQYEVDGKSAKHILMIGERHGYKVVYTNISAWKGDIPHQGEALRVNGIVGPDDIKITCKTPRGSFSPDTTVQVIERPGRLFDIGLLVYFIFLIPLICVPFLVFYIFFKFALKKH